MKTLQQVLADAAHRLSSAGVENARLDARVLLAHVLNTQSGALVGNGEISAADCAKFDALIARRAAREPVAYITGHKEFWSLDFEVGPGVLVPRPETETLIEQAMLEFPDRGAGLKAIDFGTGSACIALSFLSEFPNASAIGVERLRDAIVFAERNRQKYPFGARLALLEEHWARAPAGPLDIVFSNPPYLAQRELADVAPELRTEPQSALASGVDGFEAYRALAPLIAARLKPNGRAFLEIGAGQGEKVAAILTSTGLETVRIAPDLSGAPRCIVARPQKTVGKRGPSL
jgi:release factor glutamine methyltransferase